MRMHVTGRVHSTKLPPPPILGYFPDMAYKLGRYVVLVCNDDAGAALKKHMIAMLTMKQLI